MSQTKSIKKAAEICFKTPPSVNISVTQLEMFLGTKLFERIRGRGSWEIKTTEYGEQTIQTFKRILKELDALKERGKCIS
tara:strand:- start:131 stop:370 length:240 start_codon:yes stop_codon:yes gene_type:complete